MKLNSSGKMRRSPLLKSQRGPRLHRAECQSSCGWRNLSASYINSLNTCWLLFLTLAVCSDGSAKCNSWIPSCYQRCDPRKKMRKHPLKMHRLHQVLTGSAFVHERKQNQTKPLGSFINLSWRKHNVLSAQDETTPSNFVVEWYETLTFGTERSLDWFWSGHIVKEQLWDLHPCLVDKRKNNLCFLVLKIYQWSRYQWLRVVYDVSGAELQRKTPSLDRLNQWCAQFFWMQGWKKKKMQWFGS